MPVLVGEIRKNDLRSEMQLRHRLEPCFRELNRDFFPVLEEGSISLGLFALSSADADEAFDFFGNWVCLFDGRIDNLFDLMKKFGLSAECHNCSVTRVLNKMWRTKGPQLFVDLIGDFVLVFVNRSTGELHIARDHAGVRPLYFSTKERCFRFSSEMALVKALTQEQFKINEAEVSRILTYGHHGSFPMDQTFIKDVYRAVPGEYLSWNGRRISRKRFWDPIKNREPVKLEFREAAHELRRLLEVAVARRAEFHSEIGSHVSGGLDCSTIAVILKRFTLLNHKRTVGFSWTPSDSVAETSDELQRISAVSSMNSLNVVFVSGKDYLASKSERQRLAWNPWKPWRDMEWEYHVQQLAARFGIRHIMSGWGGDEFASSHGTGIFSELALSRKWASLYRLIQAKTSGGWKQYTNLVLRQVMLKPLKENLPNFGRSAYIRERASRGQVRILLPSKRLSEALSVRASQWRRYMSGYLVDRMESWYSYGGQLGITYSFPLLDRDVMDFVFSLPGEYFYDGQFSRKIYREAVEPYWPSELVWQVTKSEPGLLSFISAGSQRDSHVLKGSLWALNERSEAARFVDRNVVDSVFDRIVKQCASPRDMMFLARLEWALRSAEHVN